MTLLEEMQAIARTKEPAARLIIADLMDEHGVMPAVSNFFRYCNDDMWDVWAGRVAEGRSFSQVSLVASLMGEKNRERWNKFIEEQKDE